MNVTSRRVGLKLNAVLLPIVLAAHHLSDPSGANGDVHRAYGAHIVFLDEPACS
jgi:hypothetical protein